MTERKKQIWRRVGNIIITILTALLTASTAQSCIANV